MRFLIPLDKNFRRPVLALDEWFHNCRALLDTGAVVPVWTAPKIQLIKHGGKFIRHNASFGGFGGIATGDLYSVDLKFGLLTYKDLNVIVYPDSSMNWNIILPATMFNDMMYLIDDEKHRFILDTLNDKSVIETTYDKNDNRSYYTRIVQQSNNDKKSSQYTCINRLKGKDNNIHKYIILDRHTGNKYTLNRDEMKRKLKDGIDIDNLQLASDEKIRKKNSN